MTVTIDTDGKSAKPEAHLTDVLSTSLFDRLISRQRPLWVTLGVSLLLILAPFGAAYLDGALGDFFSRGYWRVALLTPTAIIYILIVAPILARSDADVIKSLRSLMLPDSRDDSFDRLVNEASRFNPIGEAIAFGIGAVFGLWFSQMWVPDADTFWLKLYQPLSAGLTFGLLGWTVFAAVAGTRLMAKLYRQPLRIDIFDTKPFEPVGRQSLLVALVFVGGFTLGMVFSFEPESFLSEPESFLSWQDWLLSWRYWLINIPLVLVPILVFFVNMYDPHRMLAAEKTRELEAVQRRIRLACRTLMERMAANEDTGTLGAEINALVAYEERLQETRTWPYNTATLRTLFFSVLVPGGAALGRFVIETLSQ